MHLWEKRSPEFFLSLFVVFLFAIFVFVFLSGRSSGNYSESFLESFDGKMADGKVSFSFTVSNFEGHAAEYSYSVFFDGEKVLEGSKMIENRASETFNESFFVGEWFSGKKKVLVEIWRPGYDVPVTLFFWVSF